MMRYETEGSCTIRLKDAKEFLESARMNFQAGRFKASVDNAADSAIAANDAFTVHFIKMVATSDHSEAVKLHKEASCRLHESRPVLLDSLLDMRHLKTYKAVTASKADAALALRYAEAFVSWVNKKIEEEKRRRQA